MLGPKTGRWLLGSSAFSSGVILIIKKGGFLGMDIDDVPLPAERTEI
jgi:hypothetical protein